MERKTLGEAIGSGKAVILVTEKGLGKREHPFWKWLKKEGFHLWGWHGHYGMDWVFINLNSMVYAPGMPGIKVVESIREHAVTIEEFKTIWGIFARYEGLSVLEMPKKDAWCNIRRSVANYMLERWCMTFPKTIRHMRRML